MTIDEVYKKYDEELNKLDKTYNEAKLKLQDILRQELKVIREGRSKDV